MCLGFFFSFFPYASVVLPRQCVIIPTSEKILLFAFLQEFYRKMPHIHLISIFGIEFCNL